MMKKLAVRAVTMFVLPLTLVLAGCGGGGGGGTSSTPVTPDVVVGGITASATKEGSTATEASKVSAAPEETVVVSSTINSDPSNGLSNPEIEVKYRSSLEFVEGSAKIHLKKNDAGTEITETTSDSEKDGYKTVTLSDIGEVAADNHIYLSFKVSVTTGANDGDKAVILTMKDGSKAYAPATITVTVAKKVVCTAVTNPTSCPAGQHLQDGGKDSNGCDKVDTCVADDTPTGTGKITVTANRPTTITVTSSSRTYNGTIAQAGDSASVSDAPAATYTATCEAKSGYTVAVTMNPSNGVLAGGGELTVNCNYTATSTNTCPAVTQPTCSTGYQFVSGGTDSNGCTLVGTCVADTPVGPTCPTITNPTCGTGYHPVDGGTDASGCEIADTCVVDNNGVGSFQLSTNRSFESAASHITCGGWSMDYSLSVDNSGWITISSNVPAGTTCTATCPDNSYGEGMVSYPDGQSMTAGGTVKAQCTYMTGPAMKK